MLMDHEAGRKMLLEVSAILSFERIPFFLFQGTALGAYRDKGFTPTERDIDLAVLAENFPQKIALRSLLRKLFDNGYDVEVFTMPFETPRTIVLFKEFEGKVAKTDIVKLSKWKDKRFTATPVRSWIDKPYCLVHEASQVETYEKVSLFGETWDVPSPIESYLSSEYGSDWNTPKDDHTSLLRKYDYLRQEGIPHDII